MSADRDPIARLLEARFAEALEPGRDIVALADETAAAIRAQPGIPPLPPPVGECPAACPVGQAWQARALRAEARTVKELF